MISKILIILVETLAYRPLIQLKKANASIPEKQHSLKHPLIPCIKVMFYKIRWEDIGIY
jgi:hypothetical protein